MSSENKIQVKEGHYKCRSYNTLERFISYYHQIDGVSLLSGVKTIFEIGPGSGLVSRELEARGYEVTTCDFDATVHPGVVADVRSIPLPDNSFDAVMACQILEHIPFTDFPKALNEISRVSKRYAIISLPRRVTYGEVVLKFPYIRSIFKRTHIDLWFGFPIKFPGFDESGQHHWEIDFWSVSLRDVRKELEKRFRIVDEFSPPLNKYHYFFILEKWEDEE